MQKVLLAGATGYLGGCLLTEFRRRGIYVRALVRRPDQAATLQSRANEVFTGQITVPSTLRGAALEVDTVFSTVGITRQRDGLTCEEVDFQGNVNLLEEALRSGCGRFGYVSLLDGPALRHLRLADAKERFVDRLRASPITSCVVRPTGYFSDMAEVLTLARRGFAMVVGAGQWRMNPISGRDLATVCVDALLEGKTEVAAGGPRVYTQRRIVELAFSALRKAPHIWHIPEWGASIASRMLHFAPVRTFGPVEFFLGAAARDMVAPCYGGDLLEDFFRGLAESPRAAASEGKI